MKVALTPGSPDRMVRLVSEHLLGGKLCVLPTDTLYSLSGIASDPGVVDRIRKLKGTGGAPISIALASVRDIWAHCAESPLARELAEHYLPGPLTLVLPSGDPAFVHLLSGDGTLGVRVIDSLFLSGVIERTGPLTITSANLHGGATPVSVETAMEQLGAAISLYVDSGELAGTASTVVRVDAGGVRVIRRGALELQPNFDRS